MRNGRNSEPLRQGGLSNEAGGRTDAELVRAARQGDKRAFVEIVARHQAMVCGVALGVLGDFAASEDAAQEAFLIAWRKVHDLREPERLRPWLAQIARNTALGQLRRQRGHDSIEEALTVPDDSPSPDEITANEEEAALVRDSLARLPENYRLPLILFYREHQSVRAVAEALAISEDAVKQRLARGREMMREQMAGLVESVLTRTAPSPVFTMTIAAAIGALAAPAAVAAGVFAAGTAASASAASASPFLTAMSTTKTCLVTAAVVATACIPVGYHAATRHAFETPATEHLIAAGAPLAVTNVPPGFESSPLFAEWRELHETHGTDAEAMPSIYQAIADIRDPYRRRAFRAALIAEWVQVDPAGGLAFFLSQRDGAQRRQFIEEWLNHDAAAAVQALLASPSGWESTARDALLEIARRVPTSVPEVVARLPKSESYWDTRVRDAFALIAERGLPSARSAAEVIAGPNRDQALAGVAVAWAKTDLTAAMGWAKTVSNVTDRDELLRAVLIGKSAVDPVTALDGIGIVPPGGRQGYFATTTGARVLSEAAKADYNATVAWLAAHPGRLGHEDLMGIANAVTERLNVNPVAFLDRHTEDHSLQALLPAVNSALLNESAGQRAAVWEWLKNQPENETTKELRRAVLSSAAYQDPDLALKLTADLPKTPESDRELQQLAQSLFNGGSAMHRFDKLIEEAPERLKPLLISTAFDQLNEHSLSDPQLWIARLSNLPESTRQKGAVSIARAWAVHAPEEAAAWVVNMPAGANRTDALAGVVSVWAGRDTHGLANWISAMAPGGERDRCIQSAAFALSDRYRSPQEAWDWAATIGDNNTRLSTMQQMVLMIGQQNPAAARQLLEGAPFTPEMKARLAERISANR